MRKAVINGTGSYLPKRLVTNAELEKDLDTTHEWIYSRTGIAARRIANEEETTSFMASEAAKAAIAESTIGADDLDLILVATCTPNHFFPSMACHVQHALGIKSAIPAFDIAAACSGFIYAMDVASQYIAAGVARHILIVGSESMSRSLDWTDRASCVLFGDGAAALVLTASDGNGDSGIVACRLHASFDENKYLTLANYTSLKEQAFIGVCGNPVFKFAVNHMTAVVDEILAVSGLVQSDIDWLVPHQANIRIILAIAKKLNMPMSQVIVTIEEQGNTSAASIPLALDYAIKEKRIRRGDMLLLESFGGGMTWGAMTIRY